MIICIHFFLQTMTFSCFFCSGLTFRGPSNRHQYTPYNQLHIKTSSDKFKAPVECFFFFTFWWIVFFLNNWGSFHGSWIIPVFFSPRKSWIFQAPWQWGTTVSFGLRESSEFGETKHAERIQLNDN